MSASRISFRTLARQHRLSLVLSQRGSPLQGRACPLSRPQPSRRRQAARALLRRAVPKVVDMSTAKDFDAAFDDINKGGNPRWKVGEQVKDWETQYENIATFVDPSSRADGPPRVLVPLSGDCHFVKHGWDKGFHITAVDFSKVAIENLKSKFAADGVGFTTTEGSAGEGTVVHEGERVRLVVADWEAYTAYAESQELSSYDVIFDKDAFGYLGPVKGKPYAALLCKLLRSDGFVYLEVKNMADGEAWKGPPFHIPMTTIEESFASQGVPVVKDFGKQPGPYPPVMWQMAYMLRKSS